MNVKLACSVAALALAVGVSPSRADTIQVTYAGTVGSISDPTNFFGGATVGMPYQLVFLFDTGAASSSSFTPTSAQVVGGTIYAPPSPNFSQGGTVTINGISQSVAGSYYGVITTSNDLTQTFSSQWHNVAYVSGDGNPVMGNTFTQNNAYGYIQGPSGISGLPVDPNQNFSAVVGPGFSAQSSDYWQTATYDGNQWNYSTNASVYANITSFSVQDLSTPGPAPAPGPAPGIGPAGLAALALGGLYARTRRA